MPERVASQKNELEVTTFLVDFAISRILSQPLQRLESAKTAPSHKK
jgi:hypothetical protein